MNDLFNPATRTADLLKQRSPQGQLEMLDTAVNEGYAIILSGGTPYTIEWHGIFASAANKLDAIALWISQQHDPFHAAYRGPEGGV